MEGLRRALPEEVPRIALVDTFCDERESALKAARVLKEKLKGVRLDTPSSRRGNMRAIVEEVKWTLRLHGLEVPIIVSGGLDEEKVEELRDLVDAFGVGTSIAFPPSVDVSADIVEVLEGDKWVPRSKRGKLPGFKQLFRDRCFKDEVLPWGSEGKGTPLLTKVMEGGEVVTKLPKITEIRDYVLRQLEELKTCRA